MHEMVLDPDDMGKGVSVGGKWTLLRNKFRAPVECVDAPAMGAPFPIISVDERG